MPDVCVNHRGYKQYSYSSLCDRSFPEIRSDIQTRRQVMQLIEEKEYFANCTQFCKPHESNKVIWDLQQRWPANPTGLLEDVRAQQCQLQDKIRHPEFI